MKLIKKAVSLCLAAVIMLDLCSCAVQDKPVMAQTDATSSENIITSDITTEVTTTVEDITTTVATTTEVTTTAEPEPQYVSATIICAGDNLIHRSIYNQAKRRATANGEEGYDFSFVYEQIEHYIQEADFAILNQETIITDELEPSDYPKFCSPADLGEHMIEIGFDAFSISNNHILDRGEEGLRATLDYWDSHPEVIRYGAYRDEEDMNNIRTAEVNGITFAFLGYMEHTNGLSLPDDSVYEITYLREIELVKEQIKRADEIADVVVVSPHFGKETTNKLTDNQINLTKMFVEWGADIIIGTQPHTVQTMEYIDKPDGGKAFVFYCLGNFVSAQSYYLTMVGMLGQLTVTKELNSGEITIENVKAIPIITQYGYNYSNIHIVPYVNYTDEMLAQHGCEDFGQKTIDYVLSFIPEEFLSIE